MGKAQGKNKGKGSKQRRRKKPPPPPPAGTGEAAGAAAKYLEQWALQQQQPQADPSLWKFNKTRQTFLLKFWSNREKLSSDAFKTFLAYAQTLPTSCAERTIAQAREVVASSEAAEQTLLEQQQQHEQQQAAKAAKAAAAASGDGGGDDDDDDWAEPPSNDDGAAMSAEAREEKRAILKIQRVRALRLLKALVEQPTGAGTDEA